MDFENQRDQLGQFDFCILIFAQQNFFLQLTRLELANEPDRGERAALGADVFMGLKFNSDGTSKCANVVAVAADDQPDLAARQINLCFFLLWKIFKAQNFTFVEIGCILECRILRKADTTWISSRRVWSEKASSTMSKTSSSSSYVSMFARPSKTGTFGKKGHEKHIPLEGDESESDDCEPVTMALSWAM
jgi:hypothetical protein